MMQPLQLSLENLLGTPYMESVCQARAVLTGQRFEDLWQLATAKVDFLPSAFMARQEELMRLVGQPLVPALKDTNNGAATNAYAKAQRNAASPLSALGCFRLGEDGRLYFAAKSEHYQIPLGHSFPGYALVEIAKQLGIPNATHNNTRGYITRLCERHLVAAAAGIDPQRLPEDLLASKQRGVLNRAINLDTGSLAVEAALKMMLNRFFSITGGQTEYHQAVPVFLVMADQAGGNTAGYHGTTFLAQTLRGLWPEFAKSAEQAGAYRVVPVPINDGDAFCRIIEEYNRPPFKTAGFCHEIIMMNYGAIVLEKAFLQQAYEACQRYDTPVLCDEIQSCGWYEGVFLFPQYGIKPDLLSIGKGLPGGNYSASRLLCSPPFDNLIQFGALITNGQAELASLCYLITMAFIAHNGQTIADWGRQIEQKLKAMAAAHPALCDGTSGERHMSALRFNSLETVVTFCDRMQNIYGIDISAQAYKPSCPPTALMKLPLITTPVMMDILCDKMDECLSAMESEG